MKFSSDHGRNSFQNGPPTSSCGLHILPEYLDLLLNGPTIDLKFEIVLINIFEVQLSPTTSHLNDFVLLLVEEH